MNAKNLSPGEMKKARNSYFILAFFNVLSFQLITGNIISLYALRLGAGNSLIGLISSFLYVSLFFLFVGRMLVRKLGVVRLMGIFFIIRYILFIPMPLAVLFAGPSTRGIAFAFMLIAAAGFNIARGIAVTGDSPIVAQLSGTKDRGVFLSKIQIIAQIVAISSSILMALVLGEEAPLWRFVIIISIGILSGLIGSLFIFKLPEPTGAAKGAQEKILKSTKEAFSSQNSRVFFALAFSINLFVAMFGSFLVIFLKNVYAFPDNRLVLFSALTSVGALVMAVLSGYTMDRIGTKPLLFAFTFVGLFSIFIAIGSPVLLGIPLMLYAGLLFFLWGMGSSGMGNATLSYFISMTQDEKRLNYGIIYYFIVGLGGTIGSIAGGLALDLLMTTLGLDSREAFRIFFSVTAFGLILVLFGIKLLENAGAYPIKSAIMFILSPRDMRALTLLRKLDTAKTEDKESRAIRGLQMTPSRLAMEEIMQKVKSPSFQVRYQALEALEKAPLNDKARQLLIAEIKNKAYTTGSLAAKIIGNQEVIEAAPYLHKSLLSTDDVLAGESMLALAKLGDATALSAIEDTLKNSRNPRLIIYSVKALEYFRQPSSLLIMLRKLEFKQAPFIRDEIMLSLAKFFLIADWFYPRYVNFLEKSSLGIAVLQDDIEASWKKEKNSLQDSLISLVAVTQKGGSLYLNLVTELLHKTELTLESENISPVLEQIFMNLPISRLPRFRFFLSALIVKFYIDENS